ncbi:MAG: hypothetical protein JWM74_547 [Myxococcaceae bacterium]|jgi:osmotically-inducible protein OsmY|nr:hypothetical protein [Myxococcaceae bacterium]
MGREVSRIGAMTGAVLLGAMAIATTGACSRQSPEPVGHTEITSGDMPGPVTSAERDRLRRAEARATEDLKITSELQRRLDIDESLSKKGKSVTIITVDGKVTLRGQVSNPEEAEAIVDKARSLPNVIAVENFLEYPPPEL